MKTFDLLWLLLLIVVTSFVIYPTTQKYFIQATEKYPYMMGFFKTALLASMGEILVSRLKTGEYFSQKGIILKAIVWGFLGMIFVLIFKVFSSGVIQAQDSSLLPVISHPLWLSRLLSAFLISFVMNIFFAPSFMLLHRVTDTYIELSQGQIRNIKKVRLSHVVNRIDFNVFFGFVILKTIPLFWIPAHTITFLLPENFRVLMAAYLSIILGILLTLAKTRKGLEHEIK